MKVYCSNCKYYLHFYKNIHECAIDDLHNYVDTWLERVYNKLDPMISNKDNNCPYYEERGE